MDQNTIKIVIDTQQKSKFSLNQFKIRVYDQRQQANTGRMGGREKTSQYWSHDDY